MEVAVFYVSSMCKDGLSKHNEGLTQSLPDKKQ